MRPSEEHTRVRANQEESSATKLCVHGITSLLCKPRGDGRNAGHTAHDTMVCIDTIAWAAEASLDVVLGAGGGHMTPGEVAPA